MHNNDEPRKSPISALIDEFFARSESACFHPEMFLPFDYVPCESTYTISRKEPPMRFVCRVPLLDACNASVEIFQGRKKLDANAAELRHALACCRKFCANAGYPW